MDKERFPNKKAVEDQKADLVGADLSGMDLTGADLADADLRESKLSFANLITANLTGAVLVGADLGDANLSGANLSGNDTRMWGTIVSWANLTGADLNGANMLDIIVRQTTCKNANMSRINSARGKYYGCDLRGADLSSANLWEAHLQNIEYDDKTSFKGAFMKDVWVSSKTLFEQTGIGGSVVLSNRKKLSKTERDAKDYFLSKGATFG